VRTSFKVPDRSGHSSFHDRVVPDLVLRIVGVMHLARRAFKAFTHLALDLTLFVRVEGFLESGQFLVSWPCGVEPELV
jgi:hypothetical protein